MNCEEFLNCEEFQNHLALSRESDLSSNPRVLTHVETCENPQCQADWEDARLLSVAIQAWKSIDLESPINQEKLVSRLKIAHKDSLSRRKTLRVWKIASISLLPALLITALVFTPKAGMIPVNSITANIVPTIEVNQVAIAPSTSDPNSHGADIQPDSNGFSDQFAASQETDAAFAVAYLNWRDQISQEAINLTSLDTPIPLVDLNSDSPLATVPDSKEPLFREFITQQVRLIETRLHETFQSFSTDQSLDDSASTHKPSGNIAATRISFENHC